MTKNRGKVDADLFMEGWAVYRAVIESDYLWHGMASQALGELIDEHFGGDVPIRFLDLACGDAETTSRLLRNRPNARYVGVDRSPQALAAATTRVANLGPRAELVTADFVDFLEAHDDQFDVIYVGFSAHHLREAGLRRFFAAIVRRLTPSGVFAAYEPFTLPDETRDEYIDRHCQMVDHYWLNISAEDRVACKTHIRENDYPIALRQWNLLASTAGLCPARTVLKTPDRLFQLVVHSLAN
jgi:SAM-dependent methyltransferase